MNANTCYDCDRRIPLRTEPFIDRWGRKFCNERCASRTEVEKLGLDADHEDSESEVSA